MSSLSPASDTPCNGPPATSDRVVRVAMPVPLHRTFDYSVPQDAAPVVRGSRIRANFANRNLVGIVVECDPEDAHADLKPIRKSLDAVPCASEELLDLATWLAGYYHHPIGEVLHTMLPSAALKGDPLTWNPEHVWSVRSEADETILARAPRQQALFEYLRSREATSARTVREAGFSTAQLNALIDKQLIEIAQPPAGESPLNLNAEQSQALSALKPDISGYRTTLIDGVTGSGKTEVYLQAIAEVVRTGRQVLVLVPEIALTPQTLARFQRRFPRTAVMHSNLSDSARLATWLRARDGDIQILIGTRSAVFTPFADLGLIVVDEEHDASFKQSDGLRYSARDVATKRGRDLDIPVILGSATPALETLNNALTGRYGHVQLTHRAGGAGMPQWHLIDVRGHTLDQGISPPLDRVISSHLNDGNQVLIFLNRRGYAPSFLCSHCKWRAGCEACDAAYTYHTSPPGLICHHCGARARLPEICPSCHGESLLAVGIGTQRTEEGLRRRYSDVDLYRIDRDTMRTQKRLEAQLTAINQGKRAILIGTQMLAKGHHFPNVTLVAVLNADNGFLSTDFRAPERTAAIITQVAGRSGRASKPGEVYIQTMQPDNPILTSLIEGGYSGFARRELEVRREAAFPPFQPMAMIRAESRSEGKAQQFLHSLASQIPQPLVVLGPAPAPIQRMGGAHRQQLMVQAETRSILHRGLTTLHNAKADRDIRWSIDVDPYDTF